MHLQQGSKTRIMFTESDEEEDMDTTPAAPAKKAGMVKAKEESEEDDDDDDDDDDEEDDDEEEEEEGIWNSVQLVCFIYLNDCYDWLDFFCSFLSAPVTPGKRKAETKKDTPPAKKSKSEGGEFHCIVEFMWFILTINMMNIKGLNTEICDVTLNFFLMRYAINNSLLLLLK